MLELVSGIQNGTNNTTFSEPGGASTTSLPVWYIILGFLVSFLCILGNGCVIYLVKTRSSLQSGISNTFIVSLAFADLLVGMIVFPSKLACTLVPSDVLLQRVFSELFLYWSIYNLCGMTIERFVFIVLPMKHHIYMSRQKCTTLIATCWVIPLVNFLLHFTWLYSKSEETKKFWLKNFTAIETISMVGVPALALVVLYSKIFTVAQRHRKLTANQIGMVSYNTNLSGSEPTENVLAGYQDVSLSQNSCKSNASDTQFDMLSYDNPSFPSSIENKAIVQNASSSTSYNDYTPERNNQFGMVSHNNQSRTGLASTAASLVKDQNDLKEQDVSSLNSHKQFSFGTDKPPNKSPKNPYQTINNRNDQEVNVLGADDSYQNNITSVSFNKSLASGSVMSEVHALKRCHNQELDPAASGYENIVDDNAHVGDFDTDNYLKSTDILNHVKDKEASDNGAITPGDSANTVKCRINVKLSENEDELAKHDEEKQTDCHVLPDGFHDNRNTFERNQKPNRMITKLTEKCEVNSFKHEFIDQDCQIGNAIVENNAKESENTVDAFLKSQSMRVHNLNAAFMNSFRVNNNQNGVESVAMTGQIPFPVLNCHKVLPKRTAEQRIPIQSNHASVQKQLDEENSSNIDAKKTRKNPIIDAENAMSSDERYLAFYSALHTDPIKAKKQSMKKRLGKIIQKKRRSGASVIGLVIAAFLICWGVSLYRSICFYFELCGVSEALTQAQWLLLLLNSAVNPIVYAMLKTDLRKEFTNIIRCR